MTQLKWMEKYMADAEQMFYNNQVEEGLLMLNDLLYDEPGYGSLHNHLGWAYLYYTEEVARAEMHLKMAILFDETFAPPYLHLGVLFIRSGKYDEAISYLQTGLSKTESNRVALLRNLAQAYELRSQWGSAIKAYKKAMMATATESEVNSLMDGIRRCRRKRVALFFSRPSSSW